MKIWISNIIFYFTILLVEICFNYTSVSGQAIELGSAYTDSFCIAIPKPLGYDTIDWDGERDSCIAMLREIARENALEAWRDSIARLIASHIRIQNCMAPAMNETFNVTHENTEHHYTLYYYDQAGNLVQTIPPEGVHPITDEHFPGGIWDNTPPEHDQYHISRYKYNSANQVVTQTTPDAGSMDYFFDRAQRIRFSQNAKQEFLHDYAYTKYDDQGRISEVGELKDYFLTTGAINDQSFPDGTATTVDEIKTTYDETTPPSGVPSENTRGRVAKVENDYITSYYDYDAHGNVRELTHIIPNLDDEVITMQYEYDLISGNVNEFRYEPHELDQFTQRYRYDADKRLQYVFSSDDGSVFDEDARYFYYPHGPLARIELGEDKVQGLDYYYTLQGWIKGVNMPGGEPENEPGYDGYVGGHSNLDRYFGYDAMKYALGFNDNDYMPIGGDSYLTQHLLQTFDSNWDILPSGSHKGLFNGNIALMLTDNGQGLMGMGYQYDALHRIRNGQSYLWDDQWSPSGSYTFESTYDPDGNLQSMISNGPSGAVDNFSYGYYDDATYGNIIPNRLRKVSGSSSLSDLPTQSSDDNYLYDAIGNLTEDLSEGSTLTWDAYGKLRKVEGVPEGTVQYKYDTQGNRLIKSRSAEFPTDIYVRDASGNIIAIYEKEFHFSDGAVINRIKEFDLYGSSRLGELKAERAIYNSMGDPDPLCVASFRNFKSFELSNHLGNVLNTVGDRKLGQDDSSDGLAEYYLAEVQSASDYYPFGLEMPGRTTSSDSHRFGFNGKEKDPSLSDELTHYDYGFRIYNPAIGRFLSVDPLTRNYPWYTPYQFAGNRPIVSIDIDGAEDSRYTNIDFENSFSDAATAAKYFEDMKPFVPYAFGIAGGIAVIGTGSLILEVPGVTTFLWKTAAWLSNPNNQAAIAQGGAIIAGAIDPNPNSDYSTGGEDEIGHAMGQGIRYLFRGTSSRAFAGGAQTIATNVTPTSTNPIISTLYAIFNRTKYGSGTVLIGKTSDLKDVNIIFGINQLAHDKEVALNMLPKEFSNIAQEFNLSTIESTLKGMGFNLPSTISNLEDLDKAVKEAPVLNEEQITKFVELISKKN